MGRKTCEKRRSPAKTREEGKEKERKILHYRLGPSKPSWEGTAHQPPKTKTRGERIKRERVRVIISVP